METMWAERDRADEEVEKFKELESVEQFKLHFLTLDQPKRKSFMNKMTREKDITREERFLVNQYNENVRRYTDRGSRFKSVEDLIKVNGSAFKFDTDIIIYKNDTITYLTPGNFQEMKKEIQISVSDFRHLQTERTWGSEWIEEELFRLFTDFSETEYREQCITRLTPVIVED
jgi:protein associated with RNAse G/E